MAKAQAGKKWFAAKGQSDQAAGLPMTGERWTWPHWAHKAYREAYQDQANAKLGATHA